MKDISEHKKYFNSQGKEVPSVTTILKILNNNLDGWANYMGLKGINSKQYANDRAKYGTYIHSICEKYFKRELPEDLTTFEIDDTLMTWYQLEELYHKLKTIETLFSRIGYMYKDCELSLVCDTYGGTIDLVLYNEEDDDYILVDFKTSKNVFTKHYAQLGGYTSLVRNTLKYNVRAVCVILIEKQVSDKTFINIRQAKDNEYNVNIFDDLINIYYKMTDTDRRYYFGT
jgi:hypothetical protein